MRQISRPRHIRSDHTYHARLFRQKTLRLKYYYIRTVVATQVTAGTTTGDLNQRVPCKCPMAFLINEVIIQSGARIRSIAW